MSKRGRLNNNNKGKPPVYRGKNIDMMGDPGRMERHAIDVFREMCRGKYQYSNVTEFMNRDFVYAAITAASKQLRINTIKFNAMTYAYGASSDPDVIAITNQERNSCKAWESIINSLYIVLNTGDLGTVYGLINRLQGDKGLRL